MTLLLLFKDALLVIAAVVLAEVGAEIFADEGSGLLVSAESETRGLRARRVAGLIDELLEDTGVSTG